MSLVLIVDDIAAMREQYAYDIERLGQHRTITASGGAEAIQLLEAEPVDCLILDLEMPGSDGFEVLKTMKQRGLKTPVIVYTGTGNYDRCVRAIKLGAYGFIAKDEPLERVINEIENALAWSRLRNEVARLRRHAGEDSPLIGDSRAMVALREEIARLAVVPSTVLILGESGSGKELVARQLHEQSDRAQGPFIPVNCAALSEHLVESELFGHEKGAFTGADRARNGAFSSAAGGTLFLDEIGELPAPVQAKLLRVLEDGKVTRVGSSQALKVDTRIVAATNRNLEEEIAARRFRQDLYYRLNVHVIGIPPLRDRLSDVPLLAEFFLRATCRRFGVRPKSFAPEVFDLLGRHDWASNNVRELRNTIERLVIACCDETITGDCLSTAFGSGHGAGTAATIVGGSPGGGTTVSLPGTGRLKDLKAAAERQIIVSTLERNDWHITNTARQLGLADHSSLLKIMRKHGLKKK